MIEAYRYLYQIEQDKKKEIDISENKDVLNLKNNIPPKLIEFMNSRKMYQILYGGRSSAKTRTALSKLLIRALEKKNQTILCTRQYQSSIEASTYAELKQIIFQENLEKFFIIKHDHIACHNGTKFIFKGLSVDIMQIKSIPNISVCFVEEAEKITKNLWDVLDPTLRQNGCELIVLFNPRERQSATYQTWLEEKIDEEDILRIEINYMDNPFNSALILKKIERMKENDYARYEHIYLGKVLDISEDVIFKGRFKILDEQLVFENNNYKYKNKNVYMQYGMDFGFSVDPAAFVELCFLDDDTIYINNEVYKTGLLPNNYVKTIEKEFGKNAANSFWYADCSRPDTIAQLKFDGLRIEGAQKSKGSIEAGIEYLLSKKIIIHPRCTNMIYEFYNYKYKVDKNSGITTSEIIDASNHLFDAIRYALVKNISASSQRDYCYNTEALKQLGIY